MADKNSSSISQTDDTGFSRRDFIRTSALVGAAATTLGWAGGCAAGRRGPRTTPFFPEVEGPTDLIRVGVIGCGGRGTGAAINCVDSSRNVEIVALGDLFEDRLNGSRAHLEKDRPGHCKLTDDTCFVGFDAFKRVLACDIDLVILGTPPHFRPEHLSASINAGKHVFMEKPVAVDPVGVRQVIAASELAGQKGLGIVAGTQRRHDPVYVETMNRIMDGAIGEVVGGQCYWNQGALWVHERKPEYTDMEWQCRNWLYFTWLSGDHIVEQHVHNLDVINWAMGGPPVKAYGMGGREVRTDPKFGNIFDHFAIEYEYASGARVLSMCRQIHGTSSRVSEHLIGTKGTANPHGEIRARKPWKFEYPEGTEAANPYVQEHKDLIASIRHGTPLNEGQRIADSTMTAILGRMSAYTGREISWDWAMNASKLDLRPPAYEFGDLSVPPVAVPGETKLV
jgi:predicted dehydrogenase